MKLIQAALGTGKSLIGERLHGTALDSFRREANVPIPVYLETRPAAGKLEEAITVFCDGLGEPIKRGVSVVLDDQRTADSASVPQLLDDARYLTELWPCTTFSILSRPLPGDWPQTEAVLLPNLSVEESRQLVKRLGGRIADELPLSLHEAASRPLFTILVAVATRSDTRSTPRSTGELVSGLVRRAINQAVPQLAQASLLQANLERLSVEILTRGGAVPAVELFSDEDVASLVSSGLVVFERGALRFVLDILQDWFGAQALRKQRITSQQLVNDERLLERWFYPLAMFVAEASHNEASAFLRPLIHVNPTLVSQIVMEGLKEQGQPRAFQEETQPPPYDECGRRLRETMQAWVDGLGPLAQLIAPLNGDGQLQPLGVVVGRGNYLRSWYQGEEPMPPIVELPSQLVEVSPLSPANRNVLSWEWATQRWDRVGFSPAWAWSATHDELRRDLARLIRAKAFPLDEGELHGGPLWKEIAWLSALEIMGHGAFYMWPLQLDLVEQRLEEMAAEVELYIRYKNRALPLAPLQEEVLRLRTAGITEIASPYPGPDEYWPNGWWRDPETGKKHRQEPPGIIGSSWYENFSDEGLAAHVGAIYEAALKGYEQIVATWLPTLAPRLRTATLFPARLVGVVEHPWHRQRLSPGISWHLEPLTSGSESRVEVRAWKPDDSDVFNPSELLSSLHQMYRALRPRAAHWLSATAHREIAPRGDSPALELAYEWLEADLKRAEWID